MLRLENLINSHQVTQTGTLLLFQDVCSDKLVYNKNLTLCCHFSTRPDHLSSQTMEEMQQLGDRLRAAVEIWKPMRAETINTLREILEKLQRMNRDVRISRIAGASTSIVGGVVAVVGFALIPVTFGGSLALTVVGTVVGVAGGATSAGATIADMVKTKICTKEAAETLKADQEQTTEINEILEEMATMVQKVQCEHSDIPKAKILSLMLRGGQGVGYISTLVAKFTIEGLEIARVGSIAALRLTGAGLRGAAIAGGVVSGLLIPIDIVDIAFNATKLFKKSDSKATEQLSKHISDLEEQRDKILNALPPLE